MPPNAGVILYGLDGANEGSQTDTLFSSEDQGSYDVRAE
jgi:hypothetical protein